MKEKIEIEKIEIEKIDTLEAQKKFSELLEEKKTFFLNGAWGSGKTEFLKGVEKQTPKKIIYLDLWNIKDNRTVINIAFHKLSLLKVWLVNAIIVFCLIISILMSNVINLGIASRFGIDNSSGILQMAGVIALFVAVFQLLKIQLDSIFVWLLQRKKNGGKYS